MAFGRSERREAPQRVRESATLTAICAGLFTVSVAAAAYPMAPPEAVGAAAGGLIWLAGAALVAVALLTRGRRALVAALLASAAAVAIGVFVVLGTLLGAAAATLLVAALLILDAALEMALALHLRPLPAWRWLAASGVLSLAAAGMVVGGAGGGRAALAWPLAVAVGASALAVLALSRTGGAKPIRRP